MQSVDFCLLFGACLAHRKRHQLQMVCHFLWLHHLAVLNSIFNVCSVVICTSVDLKRKTIWAQIWWSRLNWLSKPTINSCLFVFLINRSWKFFNQSLVCLPSVTKCFCIKTNIVSFIHRDSIMAPASGGADPQRTGFDSSVAVDISWYNRV